MEGRQPGTLPGLKSLGWFVLAISLACGSSRPVTPAAAIAPVAVTKPASAGPVTVVEPAEPTTPVIPDTAAGHTLAAWLDAFNSGDAARMKAFVERYKDPEELRIINNRERTGGFDLVAIEHSECPGSEVREHP
jgi:hypothetical protein